MKNVADKLGRDTVNDSIKDGLRSVVYFRLWGPVARRIWGFKWQLRDSMERQVVSRSGYISAIDHETKTITVSARAKR